MIAGKLLEKSDDETLGGKLGYNAATDKFEDLVAAGVIDPVKVGLSVAHRLQLHGVGVTTFKRGCHVALDGRQDKKRALPCF